jgi:PIN domain nuclease of toxin-antitoxin system
LPKKARDLIEAPSNSLFFSAASIWEAGIKSALGRPDFVVDVRQWRLGLLENDYEELPVNSLHAVTVISLPPVHRDPFDRILLAQAMTEDMTLVTADDMLAEYSGPILKV